MRCPNKSHPDWIELKSKLGETGAYTEYYRNGLEIPDPSLFEAVNQPEAEAIEERENDKIVSEFYTDFELERQKELKDSVKNFLEANDISYESVYEITDSEGNVIPANAVADIVAKVVRVMKGYDSVEILGEEAGHFLVEMLGENHPLYQSMMSEIEQYDIYRQVVDTYGGLSSYKADSSKLKKEAIGQLIGQMIAGTFEDTSARTARAGRWWNRVIRYLKEKANSLLGLEVFENAVVEYNPFSEAAQMILSAQAIENNYVPSENTDGTYYSLNTDEQNRIVSEVTNKHQVTSLGGSEGYERTVGGSSVKVKNRVTDRVAKESAKRFRTPRTAEQKVLDEVKAKYGTSGHQDINNIILRLVAKRTGALAPSREHTLPEDMYNTLEKHFTKFIETLPEDSVILSEITLYDSKEDEAGTVDLLVVHSDGSVSIYDWKFIDFGQRKEISFYKKQAWEIQLPRYREILRTEYGVTKFRHQRVIPIAANYKGKNLKSIQVGDVNVNAVPESEQHLLPVPMTEEMTGVETLDRLLQSLIQEKTEWENKRPKRNSTPEEIDAFRANRVVELQRIQKAIADIQRNHDISEYVNRGLDLMNTLSSVNVKELSTEELQHLVEIRLKHYGHNIIGIGIELHDEVLPEDLKEKLKTLSNKAQEFEAKFQPELAVRILELAGDNALDARKEKGWWDRILQTISRQDDPVIQSFWNLVKRSKAKTREAFNNLNSEVASAIEDLIKENPNAGSNLYDFMITEKKNGELAVVGQYSSEFYDKLRQARSALRDNTTTKAQKEAAKKWIQENTEFDRESYERGLETLKLSLERIYKEYANKEQLIYERTRDYQNQYSNNTTSLANENNRNIKVKDNPNNYSAEYKNIANSPAKTKFYKLWMERNKEFIEYTGVDRNGRFIWNIPSNLIERVVQNGVGAVVNVNAIKEQFLLREGDELGMVDKETGKPLMKVPVYYNTLNFITDADGNRRVDNRNQSRNLGEVLLQVGAMAYNHKHMSEIEANSNLLRYAMSIRETLPRGTDGGVLRNKLTGALEKAFNSSNDLEQFEDYLNYYVYGKRLKSTDRVLKGRENRYSSIAMFNYFQRWYVGKALALNPISITANAVGGHYMANMVAASGRLFSAVDYNKAVSWDLPRKDKTSYILIGLADLLDRDDLKRKARKTASYNSLTKHLTYDNLFIGQRSGDWWIRNAALVAMAKKYKVENGEIKRVGKENSPSLYDYLKENSKGGDVKLEGLKEGQLEKFVDAVQHTTEGILGNSSRDEINALRLTIAGRALLTFRSWIPNTYEARFGGLKYNQELDMHNKGRYMSFMQHVWDAKVGKLTWEMVKTYGFLGFGGTVGDAVKQKAEELYYQEIKNNPHLQDTLTKEAYLEMHVGNLRSMMSEIYIYASIIGMIMLARGDDDETLEQGSFRKYLYDQLERIKMEVATFWHPAEFMSMMKSPVPLLNGYFDFNRIGYLLFTVPYSKISGQDDEINWTKARRGVTGNIPLLNGIEKIISYIDENYDKAVKSIKE